MNFALHLLETIILTSIVILVVWLINLLIGSKAGYRWRKILWLVLAIRLIFPLPLNLTDHLSSFQQIEVNIPLPDSAVNSYSYADLYIPSENAYIPIVLLDTDSTLETGVNIDTTVNNTTNNNDANLSQNTVNNLVLSPATNSLAIISENTIFTAILIIWAVGVFVALTIRIFQYHWIKSKYLKKALLCEDVSIIAMMHNICNEFGIQKPLRIMIKKNIPSPMLFGYFNTILFLPAVPYSEAELCSVLRHELTHYKHRDLWYKLLMMFTCDLYWFNPIFRLMKKMAYRDVECICDEKATRHMSLEDKRTYCNSILKTMTGVRDKNLAFTTQFAGNKNTAMQRLENILTSPNRKAGVAILGVLIVAMITVTACVSFSISSQDETENNVNETLEADETAESTDDVTQSLDAFGMTIDSDVSAYIDEEILNKLNSQYPDLKISIIDFDDENYYGAIYDKKEYSADTLPTMISSSSGTVVDFGKAGKFADITNILEERGWLDAMTNSIKGHVSDENGRYYGIPASQPYSYGIICNVEMFEAAGLVDEEGCPIIPETWQELAETAVKIKEATGEAGFCFPADYLGSMYFINIAWCFGETDLCINNGDKTYTANLASDEAIAAMKFIKSLKWDYDILTENPLKEDYNTCYEHIGNGTAAMCISANDVVYLPTTYGLTPDKIALGAMPAGSSGSRYSLSNATIYSFSADATSEEINAGLDLIEMIGAAPVLNDAAKSRIQSAILDRVSLNTFAIGEVPVWKNTEIKEYEQSILVQYGNTNQSLYKSYFAAINSPDYYLKSDSSIELAATGLLPALESVLHEVLNNPDADVASLMQEANSQYQSVLNLLKADNAF